MGTAPAQASCRGIHEQWEAVEQKHGDKALSCVYSSYPRTHPGWKQWRPGGGQRGVEDSMHNVYILWATRWWVALKLLRCGATVLAAATLRARDAACRWARRRPLLFAIC